MLLDFILKALQSAVAFNQSLTQSSIKLDEVLTKLGEAEEKVKKIMAKIEDFRAVVADLGTELDVIVSKLTASGMSAADEDAALSELKAFRDRLKAAVEPTPSA